MTTGRIVVGACGFIGTRLCMQLATDGEPLLAVDVNPPPENHPVPVVNAPAGHHHFRNLVATHLRDSVRAELYYTAGHVPALAHAADTSPSQFASHVNDNLTAAYTALVDYAETAKRLGITAAAVVLSSVGAHRAHRYMVGYDAAKAGLESVVRSLALEYGPHLAIRSVAIGPIAQSASTAADGELADELVRLVPSGRYLDVDDVTTAVSAFGTAAFDGATGHTLILDGGLSTQLRPAHIERPPAVTQ